MAPQAGHLCRQKASMELSPGAVIHPQGLRVQGWARRDAGLGQGDRRWASTEGWRLSVAPLPQ